MTDTVDRATRSRMMAAICGRDTKPERIVRRGLHMEGLRYGLQAKHLPGRPDLVLPKWRAVIFVHGCFWHRHDCPYFTLPKTRTAFWRAKINGNRARDSRAQRELRSRKWRVATVWECAVRGVSEAGVKRMTDRLAAWARSPKRATIELRGSR